MTIERGMAEAAGSALVRTLVAGNPGPLTLDGTRTYVVGREQCVVVDPGPALADHLDAVEVAVGAADVVAICLTHGHPDHAAGAAELTLRLSAPIAATANSARLAALDPPELELGAAVAIQFDEGRLEVIPAPGHSPDHVCFHWPEARALFSGDVILGEGTSMIAPPEGDMAAYLATLERLGGLDLAAIYPGHGPLIEEPARKIEEYIEHRMARESQVLEALSGGARTVAEIRARVYADLDSHLQRAAEGSVSAHLAKLIAEGRVKRRDDSYQFISLN